MSVSQLRHTHNRRHEIAGEIVDQLATFEADLDRVMTSGARLVGLLPQARVEADLSRGVGQDAIGRFSASIARIGEAMEAAADGHRNLETLRRQFRIAVTAGGDKGDHPPIPDGG